MRRIKLSQHGDTLAVLVENYKNNIIEIQYFFDGEDHKVSITKEIANIIKTK